MLIIWFVVILIFVMLLPKHDTLLPFFIQKRLTKPRGNTVYYVIFTTLNFKAICLPSLMSNTYEQKMGVPHGSISSPVLFSLFLLVCDVPHVVHICFPSTADTTHYFCNIIMSVCILLTGACQEKDRQLQQATAQLHDTLQQALVLQQALCVSCEC